MKKKFDKEMEELLKKAKKLRKELKHPYLGTEHVVACMLDIPKYQEVFKVDKKAYMKELKDTIGVGKEEKNNVSMTPVLQASLDGTKNLVEFIYNLFCLIEEGIGVRIMQNIMDIDEYDEMIWRIDNLWSTQNPCMDLPKYLTNLNAKEYVTNPAIGRDAKIEEVEKVLLKMNKPNVLLVGKAGVGKTALVEGLAYKIQQGNVNDRLKDKIIVSVATSTLVAGTKYRGEFEEKIEKMCDFLKNHPSMILFIDEMHTTIKAGSSEGSIDMANILKPYLARGEIKVIGATTLEESEIITQDSAYNRRFTKILITEPRLQVVQKIVEESLPKFEKFYDIKIDKSLVPLIVKESESLDGKFPDKAIDLLENICADSVWNNDKTFTKKDVKRVIEELIERKNQLQEV